MRRWDLVQKVTVGVMGAAVVLIALLGGPDPVPLVLGAMMLGLPAFLSRSEPQPQQVAAFCGYCTPLRRRCACRR